MTTTQTDSPISAVVLRERYLVRLRKTANNIINHIETQLASEDIVNDSKWELLNSDDELTFRFDIQDILNYDYGRNGLTRVLGIYIRDHFSLLGYDVVVGQSYITLTTTELETDLT